jgi:6,7-dimethyl-8-ribityllumazine synthase
MQKEYNALEIQSVPGARVAILQARWHHEHTSKMVEACEGLLKKAGCAAVELFQVPGSYELPLAAKRLAQKKQYDAIVVFGAVIKGDTDHYQVILDTCIRELGRVMYEYEVPVIMELLPVYSLKDLIARSEGKNNKGIEAAQAAAEIIQFYRTL